MKEFVNEFVLKEAPVIKEDEVWIKQVVQEFVKEFLLKEDHTLKQEVVDEIPEI